MSLPKRPARDIIDALTIKGPDCWTWAGNHDPDGYAKMSCWTHPRAVARVLLTLTYGPMPTDIVVRHTCDNAGCVRPDHLLAGSQADNIADKVARNRQARGSRCGPARLTEAQVEVIRARHKAGASVRGLAREYGVDSRTIDFAVKRHTWRHVA